MRSVHDSVETVNAAAAAIVASEARVQPSPLQKRRWWSSYWCFGSQKHSKRIGHTYSLPISKQTINGVPTSTCNAPNPNPNPNPNPPPTTTPSFVAPPSTPLPPNSPSSTLSAHPNPPQLITSHIFLIGPYADETQLVSPPVFSSFTTQPSSAPLTPPPESVHMTTPSSPEAPFAHLVSSPLFDKHFNIDLRTVEAPTFVGYEHFMNYKWGSAAITPTNGKEPPSQESKILENGQDFEVVEMENNHRVSFELTGDQDVVVPIPIVKDLAAEVALSFQTQTRVRSDDERGRTGSFGSSKDFDFNNSNSKEIGPQRNWTFFPMLQSGGS